MATAAYKRVVLKLSGEALSGAPGKGFEQQAIDQLAVSLKDARQLGVEIAVVVGGGNIFRGLPASSRGFQRELADYMGMLATMINGLALLDALRRAGQEAVVLSTIPMVEVLETYSIHSARQHLREGRIVILVAGTGHPYFSTDSAAALRATELDADVLLKATKVDGVYEADPVHQPDARRFESVSYMEVIKRRLQVMDTAAVVLCMENEVPIVVFNMSPQGNLRRILLGDQVGTSIKEEC